MSMPFKIGVLQLSMEPLDDTVRMAQACDAARFDTFCWRGLIWLAQTLMEARSSTAVTRIVARETKKSPSAGASFSVHASPRANAMELASFRKLRVKTVSPRLGLRRFS